MTESPTSIAAVAYSGRSIEEVKAALEAVPVEMTRLLEGKTRDELTQPSQDGGWGIVEIVPHFRDWEQVIAGRVDRMLNEEQPELDEPDDSLWAIEHDYRSQDPLEAMEEFLHLREALVEKAGTLHESDWFREAMLPKRGVITLLWLLNNVCDHDAKHVLQARDVLA